jgi:hypothetical protein
MNQDLLAASSILCRAALILACALAAGCQTPALRQSFDFALIGDVPYNEHDATNRFPNMIEEINRAPMAFVVHNGDIKAGSTPCTDELFEARYEQFQTFAHPLIFVFGDNEWSDCGQPKTDPRDPQERLQKLREIFTRGKHSLGRRKLRLVRQSDVSEFSPFRENVRWTYGNILFAGLNIPGSANNFGQPEFAERNRANLAWLKDSFTLAARDNRSAIMIIIQANPRLEAPPGQRERAGFNDFIRLLERETISFHKPVVLVHGDSHYFRIDKPMIGSQSKRRIENFTRVETFGNPDVHWLRVTVDPHDPQLFTFRQQIVEKNLIPHLAR